MRSTDGVALRPMSLEEAVKEAAFRDRDVFVFRDHGGQAMVLHRKRDGKMELIEVPRAGMLGFLACRARGHEAVEEGRQEEKRLTKSDRSTPPEIGANWLF